MKTLLSILGALLAAAAAVYCAVRLLGNHIPFMHKYMVSENFRNS